MTVTYMRDAATARVNTFLSLLFRWRGSVWKSIWHESVIWLFLYFNLSIIYRYFLIGTGYEAVFHLIVEKCANWNKQAINALTFALGFYVTFIIQRWWSVFMMIPWPDSLCFQICAFMRTRGGPYMQSDCILRRTIARYLVLTFVLVFRDISESIKRRFPNYHHLTPNLMTSEECTKIVNAEPQRRHWMPVEWINIILNKAYKNKQIDDLHFTRMVQTLMDFRERLHNVMQYDWVNVPLVYTQVVQVLLMSYFFIGCVTAQPILNSNSNENIDSSWFNEFVLPVSELIKFMFFLGWIKVAQVMINPFGMDDDDFDIDAIIERNLMVSYACVDSLYDKTPILVDLNVSLLPHTKASAANMIRESPNPMIGSVAGICIPSTEQQILGKEDIAKIIQANHGIIGARKPKMISTKPAKSNELRRITEVSCRGLPSKINTTASTAPNTSTNRPIPTTNETEVAENIDKGPGNTTDERGQLSLLAERLQKLLEFEHKQSVLRNTPNEDGLAYTQSDSESFPLLGVPRATPCDSLNSYSYKEQMGLRLETTSSVIRDDQKERETIYEKQQNTDFNITDFHATNRTINRSQFEGKLESTQSNNDA